MMTRPTLSLALLALILLPAWAMAQHVLPPPEPPFQGTIGRTVKDSKPDFPKEVQAPKGRPTSCSS